MNIRFQYQQNQKQEHYFQNMAKNLTVKNIPTHTKVVIIGGGVIGCSVAYHLTQLGWKDIVLLERAQLTAGTTWHAAGLVEAGGFFSETEINLAIYTRKLYQELEVETGQPTGYKRVGYLEFATHPDRLEMMHRVAAFDRQFGIETQELTPGEVKNKWPLAYTEDIIAGFFSPGDGRVNPIDATMALAKGARMGGAQIFEGVEVTGVTQEYGRVSGVITAQGNIRADFVVNCAGMWARQLGKMAGVGIPLQPMEHYYLITEPFEGANSDLPVLVDLDRYAYYREEHGGMLLGLFEPVAAPWGLGGIPEDFTFGEIAPDWDRMSPYIEEAMKRIPVLRHVGIRKLFCGPESFTPDLSPIVGEAPGLQNYFVAAGLNSLGILFGGGIGRVMANWIIEGVPDVDVTGIDIARISPYQNTPNYLRDRSVEVLGHLFDIQYPNLGYKRARNIRKSAFHDRLAEAGAYFGEYAGWEHPDWFAPRGVEPKVQYAWGRQNWFEYAAAEHQATRQDVTLMDYSVMAKILVQGPDALKYLNYICTNDIDVPNGKIVYTQWLNEKGTIEADLTVTRLAADQFLILTGDGTTTAVLKWLKRHIPPKSIVFITNITSAYSVLSLQGPKSRILLSKVTSADLSNEAFPFMTMQEIDLGYAYVRAFRVSYVGELGWELYIPTEFSLHVFDTLLGAGGQFGLKHIGFQALDSLRLEKAYRDYGGDIDNTDSPFEVGLGRFVDLKKPGGFIGKEATLRRINKGPDYRMVQFLLEDPEPIMHYGEIIYRDGKFAGWIMAGNYGHTLGASVGVGPIENNGDIVTEEFIRNGSYEIDIAGKRFPAKASLQPMYDPKLDRVRA